MSDKVHPLDLGRQGRPDPSLEEVLDAVRQAVSHTLPGTVLFGDIGRSVFDDPRATRFTLGEVAPEHPVNLMSFARTRQLLNTAALSHIGIAENASDGFGGWFERIEGIQTISGIVHGYAHLRLFRSSGFWQCHAADCECYAIQGAGWGITLVQDMDIPSTPETKVAALRQIELPLRWRLARFLYPGPDSLAASLTVRDLPPKVEVSGHK